jgi:hypothetical protein
VLGCGDRQDAVDETAAQALEESLTLERGEDRRAGDIPHEFGSRVGRVHPLPAGTG